MNDKSWVSLENKMCPVCGKQHSYDCGILLDKRGKQSMDPVTVCGQGLCEEHQKLYDEDYIALVGIDPEKSDLPEDKESGNIDPSKVYRTGTIMHVKRHVFADMFGYANEYPMAFVDEQIINEISALVDKCTDI